MSLQGFEHRTFCYLTLILIQRYFLIHNQILAKKEVDFDDSPVRNLGQAVTQGASRSRFIVIFFTPQYQDNTAVHFIVFLSTVTLWHRKLLSAGACRDRGRG
jgi:hypothetical protein